MLYETIIEVVLPLALLYVMVFLSTLLTDTNMINLVISFFASIIIFPILFYRFFLRKEEKIILNKLIPSKKS
jgi:positive regulator of sigma E activity